MANIATDMTLERYQREYENDPEFIAEGLAIKVTEEMLGLLKEINLSQSTLAEKMGVSRAHISRILNAAPNMTLLTIAKIAVALGVTPDVCLNSESPRSSPILVISAQDNSNIPTSSSYTATLTGYNQLVKGVLNATL